MDEKYKEIGPEIYKLIIDFDLVEQLGILEIVKDTAIRAHIKLMEK